MAGPLVLTALEEATKAIIGEAADALLGQKSFLEEYPNGEFVSVDGLLYTPTEDGLLITPLPAATNADWELTKKTPSGSTTEIDVMELKDGAGNIYAALGLNMKDGLWDEVEFEAGKVGLKKFETEIKADPNGKALLKKLPDAVKASVDTGAMESAYSGAQDVMQEAMKNLANKTGVPVGKNLKKVFSSTAYKQDSARTSREHHEWKYCCIDSNNFSIMTDIGSPWTLNYVGGGGLPTSTGVVPAISTAPPYHKWIEHENLRKVVNLVKKFRRLRTKCGSTALWEEQGFANKSAAIKQDLASSAEYQALHALLVATSDFSI